MNLYAHCSEQRNQVSQLLSESLYQLDAVDAQIEALTTQQAILRRRIALYRDALSPIRRLPRDVLQEIFIHCLPINQNASMDASETPLLLGRVCSSWRTISQSTPYLWTSLHIAQSVDCPEDRSHYTRIRPVIVEWLSRSGTSLPLSISMSKTLFLGVKSPLAGDHDAELETVKVLLPFIHRCRRISLDVSPRSMQPVLDLPEDKFAILETFVIHRKSLISLGRGGRADFYPWSTMMRAPRIRKVWIHAPYFSSMDLILPMAQLTYLDIHVRLRKKDMGTLLRRLSECERLVSCTLRVDRDTDELEVSAHPVTLKTLETLNVFSQSNQNLGPLFSSIRTPRLRYLCCEDACSHVASHPLPVLSLLSEFESDTALEGLYLQFTPHVEQNILDVLASASCSQLKHLKLARPSQRFNFIMPGVSVYPPDYLDSNDFITEKLLPALTLGKAEPGQVDEEGEYSSLCSDLETIFVEFPASPIAYGLPPGGLQTGKLQRQVENFATFLRSRVSLTSVDPDPESSSTSALKRPAAAGLKSVTFNLIASDESLVKSLQDSASEILAKEKIDAGCQISISSTSNLQLSTAKLHDYRSGFDWEEWS